MGIRADFEVRHLPESFVRKSIEYGFEDDPKAKKDKNGNVRQRMVEKEVVKHGGIAIIIPGKPGHSIVLDSVEQAIALKLLPVGYRGDTIRPRLIDTQTGEEVSERGVPLDIERQLGNIAPAAMRASDLDVDVHASDASLADSDLGEDDGAGEQIGPVPTPVTNTIDKLE